MWYLLVHRNTRQQFRGDIREKCLAHVKCGDNITQTGAHSSGGKKARGGSVLLHPGRRAAVLENEKNVPEMEVTQEDLAVTVTLGEKWRMGRNCCIVGNFKFSPPATMSSLSGCSVSAWETLWWGADDLPRMVKDDPFMGKELASYKVCQLDFGLSEPYSMTVPPLPDTIQIFQYNFY